MGIKYKERCQKLFMTIGTCGANKKKFVSAYLLATYELILVARTRVELVTSGL